MTNAAASPAQEEPGRRELGRRPPTLSPGYGGSPEVVLARVLAIGALALSVCAVALAARLLRSDFGDLYAGMAVIWFLAGWLFWLALLVGRTVSRRVATVVALPGLGLIVLHSFVLCDNPKLASLLPVSSLVVAGNWSPLAVGWLAGLVWRHAPRPVWRRLLIAGALVAVCIWHSYGWMLGEPPPCGDLWTGGVSIQTSPATCSAAAAATLLRAHGIQATEHEMAHLCLTRGWGTTRLGLYRGLKLKTQGTPYDAEAFAWTLDQLREKPPEPVLLHVRLERGANVDPRYASDWGWIPGQAHAVIVFRFLPGDLVEVGDPSVGREKWDVDSLRVLWRGGGLRLVRR